ncbi:hypothetical protein ABZ297_22830 [Nonomuraea sp. NPDC005983]|uniref:hypothetical protein n=1 Tax=Nonomuraea sp. NPDC005983 TaxID=3155595 RepID=UPI0033A5B565
MSWELPPELRVVHNLVAGDAPWPRSDELPRLQGAGSWMELASAAQEGRAQAAPAAEHVRAAGNHSDDLYLFESSLGDEQKRMDDGFLASALVGTGTTTMVVIRTAWKYFVFVTLLLLLVELVAAFRSGPGLGALIARLRILGRRKALGSALGQVERGIATRSVDALRRAKRILALAAIATAAPTALVAIKTVSLKPWDDNSQAREDAEAILTQTPEGRAALAYAKEHGITTLYQSRYNMTWSDYDRNLNVIRIQGSDTATPEALAGEFVRQVHMARTRWGPSPVTKDFAEYSEARDKEEKAADQAAYRMGSQLGHEQAARETYLEDDGGSYHRHRQEYDKGQRESMLEVPFRLFNDGPLDFT